jgi:hypothetical protein
MDMVMHDDARVDQFVAKLHADIRMIRDNMSTDSGVENEAASQHPAD